MLACWESIRPMYDPPNRCYFSTPDGTMDYFEQEDGVPQGDPLSAVLTCLALHSFYVKYTQAQHDRARLRVADRQPGDDGKGGLAPPHLYIDDGYFFLPYEDLFWFLTFVEDQRPKYGVHLSRKKTQILTTATTERSHHLLSIAQRSALGDALSILNGGHSEAHAGLRLLGQPIGCPDYCTSYLATTATKFTQQVHRLCLRLKDPQTISSLYIHCAIPALSHLLATDVLHHTDLSTPNPTLHPWTSPFLEAVNSQTATLFTHLLTHDTPLPLISRLLMHTPVKEGGIGARDHSLAAIPAFLAPLLRSIQYAIQGIELTPKRTIHLPHAYTRIFETWRTARHPPHIIRVFKHYTSALLSSYNNTHPTKPATRSNFISTIPTRGLQASLYRHAHADRVLQALPTLDPEATDILPSLKSPLTSIPLHSLPRRFPVTRLLPSDYCLLLRRKLRLPLFPPHDLPSCPHCSKAIDCHGDHLLSCRYSKKHLSDSIRDVLHTVLSHTAPLSSCTTSKEDIELEPTDLIPSAPNKRPADVAVTLSSPAPTGTSKIAVDVVICPIHTPCPPGSSQPIKTLLQAHRDSIRLKFNGRDSRHVNRLDLMDELHLNNIALVPFTVDHLGGLGPYAHSLLYGSKHHPSCPTPPPPTAPISFDHSQIQQLYNRTTSLDIAFLLSAAQSWSHMQRNQPSYTRFGTTYRTATPLQWGLQMLALNFSAALATHFSDALRQFCQRSTVSAHLIGAEHLPNFSSRTAKNTTSHRACTRATLVIPARAL